jgi:hypothetical protein
MNETFFNVGDFPDGELGYNSMEANFDPQTEEFDQDLLYVRYPNGCLLDLDWRGSFSGRPTGFRISLVQSDGEWKPFKQVRCDRLSKLREVIQCCAREAASRPSIRHHLSADWRMSSPFHEPELDELILDPLTPLASQTDALKSQMFVGSMGFEKNLIIGWAPPHVHPGEFVIQHYRDNVERWDLNDSGDDSGYPRPSWELVGERRCRAIGELRQIVESIIEQW